MSIMQRKLVDLYEVFKEYTQDYSDHIHTYLHAQIFIKKFLNSIISCKQQLKPIPYDMLEFFILQLGTPNFELYIL